MKCPHCSYANLADSKFCQECGASLEGKKVINEKIPSQLFSTLGSEIEDVIFKPKKKNYGCLTIILFSVGIFIAIMLGSLIISNSDTTFTQTQSLKSDVFPLSQLTIKNLKIENKKNQLTLVGNLTNNSFQEVKDVYVNVSFYRDKEKTSLIISTSIYVGGANARNTHYFEVPINQPITGQFWWEAKIQDATF